MKATLPIIILTVISLHAGVIDKTPKDPAISVSELGLNQIKLEAERSDTAIVAVVKIQTAGKLTYHREIVSYNSQKSTISITYGNPEWAKGAIVFMGHEQHLIENSSGIEFKTTTIANGISLSAKSKDKTLSISIKEESLASLQIRHKDYTISPGAIEKSSTYPLPTDG